MGYSPWEWVKIGFFFSIGFSAFKFIVYVIFVIASLVSVDMYQIPVD